MPGPKEVEGKVKLTEAGASSLAAWMKRHHVTVADLAELLSTHAMAPKRALKRQAWLTLEQVGKILARAGGELTAEQLVGRERAAAIPVVPVASAPTPLVAAAPAGESRAAGAVDLDDEDDEGFGLPEAKRELLKLARDPDTAPGIKADCLLKVAKLTIQEAEAEAERKRAEGVRETDVILKFETLLQNARRQAEMDLAVQSGAEQPSAAGGGAA